MESRHCKDALVYLMFNLYCHTVQVKYITFMGFVFEAPVHLKLLSSNAILRSCFETLPKPQYSCQLWTNQAKSTSTYIEISQVPTHIHLL